MRILVPLKQILDPAGLTVNRKAGRVFVNREEYRMNPASKRALEAALRIKDEVDAEVVAVSIGSDQDTDSLLEARAMGASRSLLIQCGSIDTAGIVRALAALAGTLGGVDLVLIGHRALDSGLSSGAGLAEALNWPYLGDAVACTVESGEVRVVRRAHAGGASYELCAADLPAVVSVTRGGPAPRYAHGGAIITAYRDSEAVEKLAAADLGLAEIHLKTVTEVRGQSFPPEREFGRPASLAEIAALIR